MTEQSLLSNIRLVLVEPQGSLNVGAACRAMKNFGLRKLYTVRPGCEMDLSAVKMAMHAKDVLDDIKAFSTVEEAVKDSVLVLGTANRRGEYHEPNYSVREAINVLSSYLHKGPVSILFGREEWGLTKDDLKHCMGTVRIVTAPENTSLNLSQAVMLIAYELYQSFGNPVPLLKHKPFDYFELPPTQEELDLLYKHIESVLEMCEFLPEDSPDRIIQILRVFVHRSMPIRRETNLLMGIFSNIRGFMKKYVKKN